MNRVDQTETEAANRRQALLTTVVVATLVGVLAFAPGVQAQDAVPAVAPPSPVPTPQAPTEAARGVTVWIEAEQLGVVVQLSVRADDNNPRPALQCATPCQMLVPPGEYDIGLVGPAADGMVNVVRIGPAGAHVHVGLARRSGVFALVPIGIALSAASVASLLLSGVFAIASGLSHSSDDAVDANWLLGASLVGLGTGIPAIIVGATLGERRRNVHVDMASATRPTWTAGVAPVAGGGVVSFGLVF